MTRAEQAGEEQKTFVMLSLRSGRGQDFSNVVRGVRLCQSEGTYQIVMSVSPPAVGCSPKKGLQKGGHGSQHLPRYVQMLLFRVLFGWLSLGLCLLLLLCL